MEISKARALIEELKEAALSDSKKEAKRAERTWESWDNYFANDEYDLEFIMGDWGDRN